MSKAVLDGLVFDRISKHFGGNYALKEVSLRVARGEIVALLGENGAGKSTLIKTLGGIHTADSGEVRIDGQPYQHAPGSFGERQRVAFIHQDLGLIEWMTVAENMALSLGFARTAGLVSWRGVDRFAREALDRVGCEFDPTTRVSNLSRTEKSLVAIARALAVESDFLVLDEPTASLPADEVEGLFNAIRPLKDRGVGMIYVSHRLDEVFSISDRVAVLRDGEMVGMRDTRHTTAEELVHMIVGRKTRTVIKPDVPPGKRVVAVKTLACEGVGPVDFELRQGEILGLVGLRGAGHEAVARALFGSEPFEGEVEMDGAVPDLSSPKAAMEAGIGLVARDRTEESVAGSLSIRENTFLNPAAFKRGFWAPQSVKSEAAKAAKIGAALNLSPNDPELNVEALSGGNQQKVVVGRWLATNRKLLISEDPTAGVDVGAKAEIYTLIQRAVREGVGVIVVSTDFEEVAAVCTRALIFSQGAIVDELSDHRLNTEQLIQSASAGNITNQTEHPHAVH